MSEKSKCFKRIISVSAAAVCMISSLRIAPLPEFTVDAAGTMTAFEITENMKIGWNLGNTLDAYGSGSGVGTETCWGNPTTTKAMIDAVKAKGFNTLRVPTTWFSHLDGDNNIDSQWMARVKEVVDYAISNDMYVILNLHHENWVDRSDLGSAYNEMKPKFTKIWSQIAEAFKDYDQHLIFESMNEPRAKGTTHEWWGPQQSEVDTINNLNADFVKLIRSSSSENNKNRLLMIPGYCASSDSTIYTRIVVPQDDLVAVSIHAYTPYDFTMNAEVQDHSVFTESYRNNLEQTLEGFRKTFIAKDIPVVIGEMGASNFNNTDARVEWAGAYLTKAKEIGIPCVLWDNNVISSSNSPGECHGYLNRNSLTWYSASEPVVNKMMQVLADDTIAWGGKKEGIKYNHADISSGKQLLSSDITIDAAKSPDGNCANLNGSWDDFKNGELALQFTGTEPILALTNSEWQGWTEIKPYDVDEAKGIAYFSADQIKKSWNGEPSGIAHLFARTDGVTTLKAFAAVAAPTIGNQQQPTTTTTSTTTTTTTTTTSTTTTSTSTTSTTTTSETTTSTTSTASETTTSSATTTSTETTSTTSETTTTVTTSEINVEPKMRGDANNDGFVDMSDVVLIMQSLANPDKYGLNGTDVNHVTLEGWANADCETAKGITTNDALAIQLLLLHKVTSLPTTIA